VSASVLATGVGSKQTALELTRRVGSPTSSLITFSEDARTSDAGALCFRAWSVRLLKSAIPNHGGSVPVLAISALPANVALPAFDSTIK
jgi:hypothetical protein